MDPIDVSSRSSRLYGMNFHSLKGFLITCEDRSLLPGDGSSETFQADPSGTAKLNFMAPEVISRDLELVFITAQERFVMFSYW